MTSNTHNVLASAVMRLLRPLVRVLLRNGVSYGAFSDLAKWVYIDVADKDFGIKGKKQTNSRISTLTGLSRKEVLRVQRLPHPEEREVDEKYNRAARVISGWARDHRFANADTGQPAELPIEAGEQSFQALAKAYSGDVPYRAILDELERVGAVKKMDKDRVKLMTRAYVPQTSALEKMNILGTDVGLLLDTIDHNLSDTQGKTLRFQRKVSYNNLPQEVLPKLRNMSAEKAQLLLEEIDSWLAQHDRDSNPQSSGTGRKLAGVGIYYFEKDSESRGDGE